MIYAKPIWMSKLKKQAGQKARSRPSRSRKGGSAQQDLPFPKGRGGKRKGAGAKSKDGKKRVSHRKREALTSRSPVHVTIGLRKGLPELRCLPCEELIRACLVAMQSSAAALGGEAFRIVHYSIQNTHLHLLVEASDAAALAKGMQGLKIRIAKGLNKLWERRGSIFADRYHACILTSPKRVRNAILYVLKNAWHHGERVRAALDRFASGWCFDGWLETVHVRGAEDVAIPVSKPCSWLLSIGWWKIHGRLSVYERAARSAP